MSIPDPLNTGEVWASGINLFWESFVKPTIDKAKGKIEQYKEQQRWIDAAEAYRAHLIRHYGTIRVLGATQDTPLDDLYILENLTTHRREQIEELHKADPDSFRTYSTRQKRESGIVLIKNGSYEVRTSRGIKGPTNFYILGKPGAGKTTFLKYITIQCARYQAINRIPIFISLHEWARQSETSLFDFIVSRFDVCKFPNADDFTEVMLRKGGAILLFDGLDEVRQDGNLRDTLIDQLRDFVQKYDRCQHLVTCRIAASDYIFQGFRIVEVADFTPAQIESYGCKWFHDNPAISKLFANELKKPEHKGVYELCNTPLLLSMVCFAFDNARAFPPTRAELYEDALDVLLRKWDTSRNIQRDAVHSDERIYRELSPKRKKDLFARIAARTFEKGEYFFRRRDLERWIADYLATLPNVKSVDEVDGQIVLKAIEAQHSIFVERAKDIYSFSQLTFQEYFTALYVIQNQESGVVARLINSHLTDNAWREIFLLSASLFDNADDFFQQMGHAIQKIIASEIAILVTLEWADSKANAVNTKYEVSYALLRLTYISLDIALARALNLNLDIGFDVARSLAVMLAITLGRELALAPSVALDLARKLMSYNALYIARELPTVIDLDYGLYYSWAYAALFAQEWWPRTDAKVCEGMTRFPYLIKGVEYLANQNSAVEEKSVLAALPSLTFTTATESWQQQADQLFELLKIRDLVKESEFSFEQIDKLNAYFSANELLVQCLKVAVVSDRQRILDGLLAPPKPDKVTG